MDVRAALFNGAETIATTRNIDQFTGSNCSKSSTGSKRFERLEQLERFERCLRPRSRRPQVKMRNLASTVFPVNAIELAELDAYHILRAFAHQTFFSRCLNHARDQIR
jgi:hypothetical protein